MPEYLTDNEKSSMALGVGIGMIAMLLVFGVIALLVGPLERKAAWRKGFLVGQTYIYKCQALRDGRLADAARWDEQLNDDYYRSINYVPEWTQKCER